MKKIKEHVTVIVPCVANNSVEGDKIRVELDDDIVLLTVYDRGEEARVNIYLSVLRAALEFLESANDA